MVVALPVLGHLVDVDLVWLFAAVVGGLVTLAVALGADVAVQGAVRAADLPLPSTAGTAAAAAVVLLLVWPVQRRAAARVHS